jgi:TolB-like protein
VKFIRELRERRLVQILLSYAGGGWVLLEVADQFASRDLVPEVAYSLVLIWFMVGFPAAAMIAWHHGEKGTQRAPLSEIIVLVLLMVTALGLSGASVNRHLAERRIALADGGLDLQRVAVLFFRDISPSGELQHVAEGLTQDLIRQLTGVGSLQVVSENGTAQFRGEDLPPDSIARILDAGTIVDGTIRPSGRDIEIQLNLIDGNSGTVFRRARFSHPADQIFQLRDGVTEETSRLLRQWLGQEVRLRSTGEGTRSVPAWTQYQRAERLRKDAEDYIRAGDPAAAFGAFGEADRILESTEKVDPTWLEPAVARAAIEYRLSRLRQSDRPASIAHVRRGLEHAEKVLLRSRSHARALELRGTMNYYLYLLRAGADQTENQRLLARAKADLEDAVRFDSNLAGAHATLSHLYFIDDIASAMVSARMAYEKDAYLEVADVVLRRLSDGFVELERFDEAQKYCEIGARRFPDNHHFVFCQIRLMALPGERMLRPDPDLAWQLLARQDGLTPAPRLEYENIKGTMWVAGVIARAGGQDSARNVLDAARRRITPGLDPALDLTAYEAYMRILAGDRDGAVTLLQRIGATFPEHFRERGQMSWYWRDLQDDPRIRNLFGLR